MLASGSKGNCIYISDGKTSLLTDIGLCYRDLKTRAQQAEIELGNISAVLNTHCHSDHCKGIRTFVKRHDVPVYSHSAGADALKACTGLEEENITVFEKNFSIGGINVEAFSLPHDAPHCSGFSFMSGNSRISIATDLGAAGNDTLENMYGSGLAVIESNHDTDMLVNGRYPFPLKRRIMSKLGHLSNADCTAAAAKLLENGTKNFILAHLSEENNLPELAFASLTDYLDVYAKEGRDYFASVAYQYKISKMFEI